MDLVLTDHDKRDRIYVILPVYENKTLPHSLLKLSGALFSVNKLVLLSILLAVEKTLL